ncbi:Uridine phosphorylase, partial [Operophtera brumata]
MREFAEYMIDALGLQSNGVKLVNLTKHSQRYAMYKVGPVLSVSLTDLGVKNIEMEATAYSAFTKEAGIRAGI